ncbi:MAG TPA: 16S rRNA (uracil(1498)-N(3))-methyltransferase [Anaeromyxobacteraceae bacterium]|nr:16S rRNA (uracil(1498)-N(3))-methyltransferase [Anaeromyxobacteraceae bacterium]
MNLVLLDDADLAPDGTARLRGRRAAHVAEVLGAEPGTRILAGRVGGKLGEAEVLAVAAGEVVLSPRLDRDPPPPSPVALLLALPRPKVLRRVLQAAASMGVKRLVLLGGWRVERSYFSSPVLEPGAIRRELLLGLEQARDTVLPEVAVRRLFKPFVEDELEAFAGSRRRLLAHPGEGPPLDGVPPARGGVALAIGPEPGWTDYEAGRLAALGFSPFTLGPRALRVEVAVPFAIGQVELWLRGGARAGP